MALRFVAKGRQTSPHILQEMLYSWRKSPFPLPFGVMDRPEQTGTRTRGKMSWPEEEKLLYHCILGGKAPPTGAGREEEVQTGVPARE